MIYTFGDFELDTDCFELRLRGVVRKVEPQVFALLELLVSNHDRLVTKDEINLRVWGGRVVSEAVVNSRVKLARQTIGDSGKAQRLIRTVHGRGFRFVGDVEHTRLSVSLSATGDDTNEPQTSLADIGQTDAARPSIAVLPLQLLTPSERYGGLGDAVSQEVILELSRLHWLFVIARGSSFRFREAAVDLAEVGRILGARYILSGTIAFLENASVVTVELSHAPDGRIVWAERFRSSVDELLQLRLTIAGHIVQAIETRIQIAEATRAAKLPTENLDAWSAYHRGLWHMFRFNRHDNEIAARMFDRAVAADPDFARGYAGLSFTHFQNVLVGYSKEIESERSLTRKYAERSLELDPLDPFVNLTMGRSSWIGGDIGEALPWFDRSVELSPNFALAHYNRGVIDALLGNGAQSEENVRRAIALSPIDPLNYAMLATLGLSYFARGEYREAAEWSRRAVRAPNAHVHIFMIAAMSNELAGDRQEAERCAEHIRQTARGLSRADFLRSFNFHSDQLLRQAQDALGRLGL